MLRIQGGSARNLTFIFLLAATAIIAAPAFSEHSALAQTGSTLINAGTLSYGAAYDSSKGEIFVANWENDSVTVVSDSTSSVVKNIALNGSDGAPYGVAYDPGKGEIFVSQSVIGGSGAVSVISDSTNSVSATITVGQQASGEVYDPAKGEVFVANAYDATISVISDSSNTVVKTLGVLGGPVALAYDSSRGEVFVAEDGGQQQNGDTVTAISDSNLSAVANITVGTAPDGVAYDQSKNEIFVSDGGSSSVSVISDATDTVVQTISVGTYPFGAVYDPARGEVFVTNEGDGTLSVISDSTNSLIQTQALGSAGGIALVYDPSKGEVFDVGHGVLVFPDSLSGVGTSTANGGTQTSSQTVATSGASSSVSTVACSVQAQAAPSATAAVGNWAPTTCYPFPVSAQSCAQSGGYVYCVGGDADSGPTDAVYFAPLSSAGVGAWSVTTSYPLAVDSESCQISSGYIYCVGGSESNTITNIIDTGAVFYAPVSSSGVGNWTMTTSYPTTIESAACAASSGYIYCIGGFNNGNGLTSSGALGATTILGTTNASYYANISATGVGTWTQTTTYPVVAEAQPCAISSGYIYCVGAFTVDLYTAPSSGTATRTFSPSTVNSTYYATVSANGIGNWTRTTSYPTTINGQSCIVSSAEIYCVAGNTTPSTSEVSSVYVAPISDTGVGAWSQTTSYPLALEGQSCVTSGGSLVCMGGYLASNDNTDAVCYAQLGSGSGSATGSSTCSQLASASASVSAQTTQSASSAKSSSVAIAPGYLGLLAIEAVVVTSALGIGLKKKQQRKP